MVNRAKMERQDLLDLQVLRPSSMPLSYRDLPDHRDLLDHQDPPAPALRPQLQHLVQALRWRRIFELFPEQSR